MRFEGAAAAHMPASMQNIDCSSKAGSVQRQPEHDRLRCTGLLFATSGVRYRSGWHILRNQVYRHVPGINLNRLG